MTGLADSSAAQHPRTMPLLTREAIIARLRATPPAPLADDLQMAPIPPDTRIMHAAVLVPLVRRSEGIQVLLTQRSSHLRDHPSQISFPGGRVEGDDADRIFTALREA